MASNHLAKFLIQKQAAVGDMSIITNLIGYFSPAAALKREAINARRSILKSSASGHYDGAARGRRGQSYNAKSTDAIVSVSRDRARLSYVARDFCRNNPRAKKAVSVLSDDIVGRGIICKVKANDGYKLPSKVVEKIEKHIKSKNIDVDGRNNLYGLQKLVIKTVVCSGEVLVRRVYLKSSDPAHLPFKIQILETDYLNENMDGKLSNGNVVIGGIEYSPDMVRVAYYLYTSHPGGNQVFGLKTRRIDAKNISHVYRTDRPGQSRGVTWFAPVITQLGEIHRYQDAQIKRQEISAMFAGIFTSSDSDIDREISALEPGAILTLKDDDNLEFTTPPSVESYESFMRGTDRTIASGLGITYESLTGDYSKVNYSSARMGRLVNDPGIKDAQDNVMISHMCADVSDWIKEAVEDIFDVPSEAYELEHTPPTKPVVDPTKEFKALSHAVRSGFKSRHEVIRENGGDPVRVDADLIEDSSRFDESGVLLETSVSDTSKKKGNE